MTPRRRRTPFDLAVDAAIERERVRDARPVTFDLPVDLASLNQMKGRHWRYRHAAKKHVAHALAIAGARHQHPPDELQHVTLTRILGPGQRRFDFENLTGGTAKAIIDALTDLGYWKDDSDKWLTRTYKQDDGNRTRGPRTLVQIEWANDAA